MPREAVNEAARISRETTIGPLEVQRYLDGGIEGGLIEALHGYACTHNVSVCHVIEKLFSRDPVNGYQVRPGIEDVLRELGMVPGV